MAKNNKGVLKNMNIMVLTKWLDMNEITRENERDGSFMTEINRLDTPKMNERLLKRRRYSRLKGNQEKIND